ncbi:MAG: hypothetical protein SF052_05255 [Bacteroidia bacterium]|nr:hypothetical protein [Bacteroidia bacterium]
MRAIFIGIISTLSLSVFAQNAMFIPFGQSVDQVSEYLYSRDYAQKVDKTEDSEWVNKVSNTQSVVYFFDNNVLYAIEDARFYKDRKEFDRVVKTCLDFMSMEKHRIRTLDAENGVNHYAVVTDDRLVELIVETGKKEEGSSIRMKSTSRLYGPRMKTEDVVMKVVQ